MAKKLKKKKVSKKPILKETEELETKKIEEKGIEGKGKVFYGFFEFLKKYSVIGLAIGLVIGNSSQNVVKAIVDGLVTPALNLIFSRIGSLKDYAPGGFKVGQVVQSFIEFIIILFLVYFLIKIILKRDDLIEEKKK
jgi:large conductance mechanosensitive channel